MDHFIVSAKPLVFYEKSEVFCFENFEIYLKGFCYLPGFNAGKESLNAFVKGLKNQSNIFSNFCDLKGQYFIAIHDLKTQKAYCFTDQGGHFHAFHSESHVSTSFLKLTRLLQLTFVQIDKFAVAEFLHWGNLHHNRTFFKEITRIKGWEVVEISAEKKIVHQKPSSQLDQKDEGFAIPHFFKNWSHAIKNEKIIADLTGGYDSRLLVSILKHHQLTFELLISGNQNHPDVKIAGKIASDLKIPLHIYHHQYVNLTKELQENFIIQDGLAGVISSHRSTQMIRSMANGGFTLSISGAGGEIYKDFPWLTDFPLYWKQKPNLKRYFNLRFCPYDPDFSLFQKPFQYTKGQLYEFMSKQWLDFFPSKKNTQTYDHIYYYYKWPSFAGRFITGRSSFVNCSAPYLMLDLAKHTYHLPRLKRFFNFFHRTWIGYFYKPFSTYPTTESGMSSSLDFFYLIKDSFLFVINRTRRVLNKIAQKTLKINPLGHPSPDNPRIIMEAKNSPLFQEAIEILTRHHVIKASLNPADIDNKWVDKMITLSLLINYLSEDDIEKSS